MPEFETQYDEALIKKQHGAVIIFKVVLFTITLILMFTGISHLLPQTEGHIPKEQNIDLTALSMEDYLSMGEKLYQGKGSCLLCHNNLGRAPDIIAIGMRSTTKLRLNDPLYQGEAKDPITYYLESMVTPSKYVVAGYGKPGEASQMPAINKAPIALSDIEMEAIIAYLQAKDGLQPSVKLPSKPVSSPENNRIIQAETPVATNTPEQLLKKYGCIACHTVSNSLSTIGPELTTLASRASKEQIRQSIIDPAAIIAPGFPPIMPADYINTMTIKELEMLVSFLAKTKTEPSKQLKQTNNIDEK